MHETIGSQLVGVTNYKISGKNIAVCKFGNFLQMKSERQTFSKSFKLQLEYTSIALIVYNYFISSMRKTSVLILNLLINPILQANDNLVIVTYLERGLHMLLVFQWVVE